MIRTVLDTNVFLSGLKIADSKPAQLIDFWREGKFDLILSDEIIDEYTAVLSRPHLKVSLPDIFEIIYYLYLKVQFVELKKKLKVVTKDLSDNIFLERTSEEKPTILSLVIAIF